MSASEPPDPARRIVEVDGLDAGYNGSPVVRDLTLHVGEAEVVALLGANGAGKTTTLATIAGLQRPLAGRIRMDGQDIAGSPHTGWPAAACPWCLRAGRCSRA